MMQKKTILGVEIVSLDNKAWFGNGSDDMDIVGAGGKSLQEMQDIVFTEFRASVIKGEGGLNER